MKIEFQAIEVKGEMVPALDIPAIGRVIFVPVEPFPYIRLNRNQLVKLRKAIDKELEDGEESNLE